MLSAGDQIHRHAAAGVEMGGIGFAVRIDGNQHSLTLRRAFKDALLIRQYHGAEAAVIQRLRSLLRLRKLSDELRQLIFHRLLKAGAKRRIAVAFISLCSPLASIINTGNPRHSERERINQRQMLFIGQNASHTAHIVVVHKGHQMQSLV